MHQQYDNNLSVGDLCLIIGTSKPENSFMIGRTVAVEYILQPGDYAPEQYGDFTGCKSAASHMAIVSSQDMISSSARMLLGYHLFDKAHLLPIKPMKDVELSFEEIGKLVAHGAARNDTICTVERKNSFKLKIVVDSIAGSCRINRIKRQNTGNQIMKFSNLPKNIQIAVKSAWVECKEVDAEQRSRYFKENGFKSSTEYNAVVLAEVPKASELRDLILHIMKVRYLENGIEDWMRMIPNADMVCHRHKELHMCSLARK